MPIAQPDARSSTVLTVRLTPSTATDPLTARKRASAAGASTSSAHDSPTRAKRVTRPTPSTWPETRWPSSRASARIAFSRLTSPAASRPAVLSRLSAEISTWNRRAAGSRRTTVMQAPDRAMLSPRATSSRKPGGASIVERLAEGRAGAERLRFDDAADAADDAGEHGAIVAVAQRPAASRRRQRSGRRRNRRSSPIACHVDDAKVEALRQRLERPERGQAATAAEQARCDVDQQLVDPAFLQQRGVELLAGLDMQLVDAAPAEVGEHRGQVDLAAG